MTPIQQLRAGRLSRRLTQLTAGLVLYGVSMGLMFRSTLGLDPWDVLHAGLAEHLPLTFGQVVIATSFVVLLLWIPLKQWPGLGTLVNAVLIGVATDVTLGIVTTPDHVGSRILMLLSGIALNGVATGAYIGAELGPGPRDGLMTGLVRRTGLSVRLVRTSIEVSVLVVGFLLGGTVGVGTVLYAISIGPLVQVLLPLFQTRFDLREHDAYFDILRDYRWARPAW
jgi:uncharacterized membrane protein YczE